MTAARGVLASACFALVSSVAAFAHAEEAQAEEAPDWRPGKRITSPVRGEVVPRDRLRQHDGVYGRFDGDLTFTLGLGAELHDGARGAVIGRALYYHSFGLTVSYTDALGGDAVPKRVVSGLLELRPLFLPRWAYDLEWGRPLLDLTVDSLSLGAGVFVARRGDPTSTKAGLELSLGVGVPLFAKAEGLWLEARGFLRPALDEAPGGVMLALSLYESVITPLVE